MENRRGNQQGRDRGRNVLDVRYDRQAVTEAIEQQRSNGNYPQDPLYGEGRAGENIARLLAEAPLHAAKRLTY